MSFWNFQFKAGSWLEAVKLLFNLILIACLFTSVARGFEFWLKSEMKIEIQR